MIETIQKVVSVNQEETFNFPKALTPIQEIDVIIAKKYFPQYYLDILKHFTLFHGNTLIPLGKQ